MVGWQAGGGDETWGRREDRGRRRESDLGLRGARVGDWGLETDADSSRRSAGRGFRSTHL